LELVSEREENEEEKEIKQPKEGKRKYKERKGQGRKIGLSSFSMRICR